MILDRYRDALSRRRRHLVALGVLAIAWLSILGFLLWSGYREAIHTAEVATRDHAVTIEARLDATLRRADADLQDILRTLSAEALSKQAVPRHAREVEADLDMHLRNFPELAGMRIFDINGDRLYSSAIARSVANMRVSDRAYFRRLRENPQAGLVISEVIKSRTTGQHSMPVARAITDERGAFRGVVAATVDLDFFQKLFRAIDLGPGGVIAVHRLDDFTRVVRCPPAGDVLNAPLPPDSPVRRALAGDARNATVEMTSAADGMARIYSFRALSRYPFFVTVGIARDDALAAWRKRTLGISLLSVLLTALLGALLLRLWLAEDRLAESEELMRGSFEHAAVGIAHIEPHTLRILLVNAAFCRLLGYTREELIGTDSRRLTAAGEMPVRDDERARVMSGAVSMSTCERRLIRKDGSFAWVSRSLSLVRDAAGNPRHFISVIEDITGRKRSEEARARLVAVAEGSHDAIFIRDAEKRIVFWNEGAHHMYGYTAAEILGKDSAILVPPELQDERRHNWERLQRGETLANFDTVRLRKDGSRVDVSIGLSVVRDADGQIAGLASVARDVTERKRAEQAHAFLAAIVETANVAIYSRSMDGTILTWNAGAEKILGYSAAEAIGQAAGFALPPGRPFHLEDNNRRALSGEVIARETDRLTKDGRVINVLASHTLIRDSAGKIYGVANLLQDITALKQAERARATLATIVENAHDVIIGRALDGTIVSWNRAAETMFGYSAAEAVGRPITIIMPPGVESDVERNSAILRAGGQVPVSEVVRRSRQGRLINVARSISPIRDAAGEVSGAAIILHDISALKQAEANMRLAASVFETAAEGIVVTDRDARIVSVNPAFTEITGYAAAEVMGKNPLLLTSDAQTPAFFGALSAALESTGRWQGEIENRRKGGERYFAWLSIHAIPNTHGIGNYCGTFIDITARKRAEAEIAQLNAELENRVVRRTAELAAANDELNSFSYTVAHDLRAPVRAMNGFSSMVLKLNENKLDETSVRHLKRVVSGSQRMGALIDDLLNMARLSRRAVHRRELNLSKLAAASVAALSEAQPQRSVKVMVQPDLHINGDPGLLRVVMDNLIGNAWKFTAKRPAARIEIGALPRDGQTVFFVRDNGAGFDMNYAHKLFMPFQRLHSTDEFEGTGVGLATVKKIIQRHGGNCWVESGVDQGTTVFFTVANPAP